MRTDPETGFPVVPEEYFWRVSPYFSSLRVELRKRFKYVPWWSTEVSSWHVTKSNPTQQDIARAAALAYEQWQGAEKRRSLVGDYLKTDLGGKND